MHCRRSIFHFYLFGSSRSFGACCSSRGRARWRRAVAGEHDVPARRAVRDARRAVHRRHPGAGVRRRDHGRVPVRHHAAEPRAPSDLRHRGHVGSRGGDVARRRCSASQLFIVARADASGRPRAARRDARGGRASPRRGRRRSPSRCSTSTCWRSSSRACCCSSPSSAPSCSAKRQHLMLAESLVFVSAVLFTIGVVGVLTRRNAIIIFMCVELMLNAVNLTFVAFAQALRRRGPGVRVLRHDGRRGGSGGRARDHHRDLPAPADGESREHQSAERLMLLQKRHGRASARGTVPVVWLSRCCRSLGFVINGALVVSVRASGKAEGTTARSRRSSAGGHEHVGRGVRGLRVSSARAGVFQRCAARSRESALVRPATVAGCRSAICRSTPRSSSISCRW